MQRYMGESLDEYRTYLENLAAQKSPTLFSNGGKDYASILMSILLKNTTHSVHMFCEGFKPDLIKQHDYWEALTEYLNQKDKELHVIVNTNSYCDQLPLQTLFNVQRARGNDSIQVRLISEEGREKIKKQFNGALNNFAVFDKNMYRLEYEPSDYKAFGSFNDPKDSELLLNLFNEVFNLSKDINGAIAQ